MWIPEQVRGPRSSFPVPVPDPGTEPLTGPNLVCVEFDQAWAKYAAGAISQLVQPTTWRGTDAQVLDLQARATELLTAIGNAQVCMEAGRVLVTISAGAAVGTVDVTFPMEFPDIPVVVVSENSGIYIASANSVATTGFAAHLTAAEEVLVDSSATLSWLARRST